MAISYTSAMCCTWRHDHKLHWWFRRLPQNELAAVGGCGYKWRNRLPLMRRSSSQRLSSKKVRQIKNCSPLYCGRSSSFQFTRWYLSECCFANDRVALRAYQLPWSSRSSQRIVRVAVEQNVDVLVDHCVRRRKQGPTIFQVCYPRMATREVNCTVR